MIDSRFEVVRLLGQGTSGAVYQVRDRELNGADFALKLIHPQLIADPSTRERIQREMMVNRQLNHRNIVRVYECALTDTGNSYLLAELVVGCTLEQLLRASRRLCPNDAAAILWGIATGLKATHDSGVIHRDLKPQNILLSRTGDIKLVDFGLARLPGDVLQTSQVLGEAGTPVYMAPEQFRGKELDQRADIYSLGAVAYELVVGSPPVNENNIFRIAEAHIRSRWIPLDQARPGLPSWYIAVVERMLQADPDNRASNLDEILAALVEHIPDDLQPHARSLVSKQESTYKRTLVTNQVKRGILFSFGLVLMLVSGVVSIRSHHSLYFRAGALLLAAERRLGVDLLAWRELIDFEVSVNDPSSIFGLLKRIKSSPSDARLKHQALSWVRSTGRIDQQHFGNTQPPRGRTPLHYFADQNLRRHLDEALRRGADPNAQDQFGDTPLHLAVLARSAEILQLLAQRQQTQMRLNHDGRTPLHVAILSEYPGRLAQLLESLPVELRSHAVNQRDGLSQTPLEVAGRSSPEVRAEMQNILVSYGARLLVLPSSSDPPSGAERPGVEEAQ